MGFLKFLKREKRGSDLDLPPAPPPLEGFDDNLPELPEMPDIGKISAPDDFKFDLPEETELPDLKEEPMQDSSEPELPEFHEMPETWQQPAEQSDDFLSQAPEPAPAIQANHPIEEEQEMEAHEALEQSAIPKTFPRHEKRIFIHEKKERALPRTNSTYVRVDKFKATLGSINIVRNDLRKADEVLMKLENLKISKDRSFDKVRSLLDDLQKKLIFVDKTLFKGE